MQSSDLSLNISHSSHHSPEPTTLTHNDQHAPTKNSSSSDPADSSSEDQDPHTGCHRTDERAELKDEYRKDNDMFRREDLGPLGVDQVEAEEREAGGQSSDLLHEAGARRRRTRTRKLAKKAR
jgi:hypothetical protein